MRVPLIEDCAHTIDSCASDGAVGTFGDWVVCSLSKLFPCRGGGALVGPAPDYEPLETEAAVMLEALQALGAAAVHHEQWRTLRREVYESLLASARSQGLHAVHMLSDGTDPWLFPLHVPDPDVFIEEADRCGVETGRWYGTDVVVYPCHQYMRSEAVALVAAAIKVAAKRQGAHG
jgi:hypothetical protein